jgi:hypothetical protein
LLYDFGVHFFHPTPYCLCLGKFSEDKVNLFAFKRILRFCGYDILSISKVTAFIHDVCCELGQSEAAQPIETALLEYAQSAEDSYDRLARVTKPLPPLLKELSEYEILNQAVEIIKTLPLRYAGKNHNW